jgi:hypothetical protein
MNHLTLQDIADIPNKERGEEILERLESIVPETVTEIRRTQMYIDAVKRRINELIK